jgi:hypothetical protein
MDHTTPPQIPTPQGDAAHAAGFSSCGLTNTALGDAVEAALVEQLDWSPLHEGSRWGRLDVAFTLRGRKVGAEVKAVSVHAREFKAKMKASERLEKLDEAQRLRLDPATVIVVVMDDGYGLVWAAEGIVSARLSAGSDTAWFYQGKVKVA